MYKLYIIFVIASYYTIYILNWL